MASAAQQTLRALAKPDPRPLVSGPAHGGLGGLVQPLKYLLHPGPLASSHEATVIAPLCVALALTFQVFRRLPARAQRRFRRTARRGNAANSPEPTLKPRIWEMLGLRPGVSKKEIRRGYKMFVMQEHPDVKGDGDSEEFKERFLEISTAYKEVMKMNDDEFWLETFDAGCTQMSKGDIDLPSLNPWEKKYRKWRREQEAKHQWTREKQAEASKAFFEAKYNKSQEEVSEKAKEGTVRPDEIVAYGVLAIAAFIVCSLILILLWTLA